MTATAEVLRPASHHVKLWFWIEYNAARQRRSLPVVDFAEACETQQFVSHQPIEAAVFAAALAGQGARQWTA